MMRLLAALGAALQLAQNPSPMVETTRAHTRLSQQRVEGTRFELSTGSLLVTGKRRKLPLVVHFHGAPWLVEASARSWKKRVGVVSVQLGAGSGVYARAFTDRSRFADLVEEASRAAGVRFTPVVVSAFSAGYGAVREILKEQENWRRIDAVVLADGLHTGYETDSTPGPLEASGLAPFLALARDAIARRERLVVTHSEIFPGTFASTTETADHLLAALGLRRRAVLKWGPVGMQQLSEAKAGRFQMLGFAGNAAPDHVDHLHALVAWLKRTGL